MKIFLIRHGEGYHNLKNIDNSNYNILYPMLTDKGILQSKILKKYFNNIKVDSIVVSPLERTLQTYYYIFDNKMDIPVISLDLIREIIENNCDYRENINLKKKKYPNINFDSIESFEDQFFIEKRKESHKELSKRINLFYLWLLNYKNKNKNHNLVVITHGAFLREFLNIYKDKLLISDISWFNNCEVRECILK